MQGEGRGCDRREHGLPKGILHEGEMLLRSLIIGDDVFNVVLKSYRTTAYELKTSDQSHRFTTPLHLLAEAWTAEPKQPKTTLCEREKHTDWKCYRPPDSGFYHFFTPTCQ